MSNQLTNKHLTALQSQIIVKKNYVMALHKRLSLVNVDLALKSEYEINEIDIIKYETLNKIGFVENKIKELQASYEIMVRDFIAEVDDIDKNYDKNLELAKKLQYEILELRHHLHQANWKLINENIDEKILFYKTLKTILSNIEGVTL